MWKGIFLSVLIFLASPLAGFAQALDQPFSEKSVADAVVSEIPAFLKDIKRNADLRTLTEEQKEEMFSYFKSRGVAQSQDSAGIQSRSAVVATVNMTDVISVEKESGIFDISFHLTNGVGVQPSVRYAVYLMRTNKDGTQTRMDSMVYPETFYLEENSSFFRTITYVAPSYLSGVYSLALESRTENGLPLAFAQVGNITLKGNGQYVEVVADTCFLAV